MGKTVHVTELGDRRLVRLINRDREHKLVAVHLNGQRRQCARARKRCQRLRPDERQNREQ